MLLPALVPAVCAAAYSTGRYVHPPSLHAAAARSHPSSTAGWLRQRLKFLFRAWTQPRFTRAWLARLIQPDISSLWAAHPRLATKLQRPYLCCDWGVPERCAALVGHYDALPRLFAAEVRTAIYGTGFNLLRLNHASSGRHLAVRLFYADQFEKEGELTLSLDDTETGLTLAGITFTVVRNGTQRIIIVGGLQANPDPRTRTLIHDVAKAMHGLRPKAFVLWCLQELAAVWQVDQIQAVGDGSHIYRHWRKKREFAASYDEFWAESDGRVLPGAGSWELPLRLQPRKREELKASRRKAHERRYEMLNAIKAVLVPTIAALAPKGSTQRALDWTPPVVVYSDKEKASGPALLAEADPGADPVDRLNHAF